VGSQQPATPRDRYLFKGAGRQFAKNPFEAIFGIEIKCDVLIVPLIHEPFLVNPEVIASGMPEVLAFLCGQQVVEIRLPKITTARVTPICNSSTLDSKARARASSISK
jgi:hypothetical protein